MECFHYSLRGWANNCNNENGEININLVISRWKDESVVGGPVLQLNKCVFQNNFIEVCGAVG